MSDSNDNPEDIFRAVNVSKGGIAIAGCVRWTGTSAERRKGLLGRKSIDPQEGMYIVPSCWIHTFGMKFPIDVAFLGKNGRVVSLQHALRPNRLSKLVLRAQGVLELTAGRLQATNTAKGDIIKFEDIE